MMLQQLLRKVRVALTPRSRLLRTRLPDGTLILGRNRAGFGGRGVYIERDTFEPELRLLPLILPPGGVLIDVGANTGVYSLVGARLTGSDGIVVSLEPFVDVLATLRLSVEANGFHNMRLRNVCAGRETGVAEFWMNHGKPNSFSLVRHDPEAEKLSVQVVSLDELFIWERLPRVDFLKIDAEGAETEVLAGARRLVERFRPVVQVEITLKEPVFELTDYVVLRRDHSPNAVLMPADHPRRAQVDALGWS